jgi:hypothetical protein
MRKILALSLLLACGGCPKGEPCDRATYKHGCDEGNRSHSYCSDKTHTGRKKVVPTVARIECQPSTVCIESGEIATCVAEPAETCDSKDASRCVNGLRQKCWDVNASTQDSGVLYWYFTGLSCDGTEGP